MYVMVIKNEKTQKPPAVLRRAYFVNVNIMFEIEYKGKRIKEENEMV